MEKFVSGLQSVLIVILALIVIYQGQCSKKNIAEPEVIIRVETKMDTVIINKTEYVPKWRTRVDVDTIMIPIDTMEVLKDFYAKYFYSDTLNLDTLGYVLVNDTVSQNQILSRRFTSKIKIPTTTITITEKHFINRNEFYWGLGVQGNKDQLNYLGGELLYKNKRGRQYGIGLGIDQDFQPVGSARIYWKIGK